MSLPQQPRIAVIGLGYGGLPLAVALSRHFPVAGQTPAVADFFASADAKVTGAGVFPTATIRTAEAAKIIENAQRDINIAFINEREST